MITDRSAFLSEEVIKFCDFQCNFRTLKLRKCWHHSRSRTLMWSHTQSRVHTAAHMYTTNLCTCSRNHTIILVWMHTLSHAVTCMYAHLCTHVRARSLLHALACMHAYTCILVHKHLLHTVVHAQSSTYTREHTLAKQTHERILAHSLSFTLLLAPHAFAHPTCAYSHSHTRARTLMHAQS